jgi:hypothetical protein
MNDDFGQRAQTLQSGFDLIFAGYINAVILNCVDTVILSAHVEDIHMVWR